jgi:hypothetical protein
LARRDNGRWGEADDEAFLSALAALRNVCKAAAAIGRAETTAYARRRRCPVFAARWDALKRPLDFARGERVGNPGRIGRGRAAPGERLSRPKYVRGQTKWTEDVERDFLDMLATTCNVSASCAAAGICADTVYSRRREHPEFERRWNAALAQGYARLEIELVRAAAESVEGVTFQERAIGPVSAETAIKLIGMHRAAATGQGRRTSWNAKPPSIEQVLESIRRRAAAIRAARKDPEPKPPAGDA